MRVKPDGFPLSSRYARALYALARPFAHVSRELRYPVHGSLLTKNSGGLLYAPPGNHKPAYIPEFEKCQYQKSSYSTQVGPPPVNGGS